MLYEFRTWLVMALYNFQHFVALGMFCFVAIPPSNCASILGRLFTVFLCPVSVKFSKPSFNIMCSRNVNCRFLFLSIYFLIILHKTSPWPKCSAQWILSILLENHIFVVSSSSVRSLNSGANKFVNGLQVL